MIRVITPVLNGPAYQAGIRAGDLITRITRELPAEGPGDGAMLMRRVTTATKGLSVADAERLLAGRSGTRVILRYQRDGADRAVEVAVVRGPATQETVLGIRRKVNNRWDHVADRTYEIGYVRLKQFTRHTYRDLVRVVAELERRGLRGLVLDLRFTNGGLFDTAVKVSDLFIGDGLVVSIQWRGKPEEPYFGQSQGSHLDFPMVCLVNGSTTEAAEVVAACLQDHRRARIIGERTRGSCMLQIVLAMPNGGRLRFTNALMIRPSGQNLTRWMTAGQETDDWGVIPDEGFTVNLSVKERRDLAVYQESQEALPPRKARMGQKQSPFRDRQMEKALWYLQRQIQAQAAS
jgi:carboxyl-terminal processing protease